MSAPPAPAAGAAPSTSTARPLPPASAMASMPATARAAGGAVRATLGPRRWHFQHGPIDLVVGADGEPGAIDASLADAWARFEPLLAELVAELPALKRPVGERCELAGPVARRMWAACAPYRPRFVTPMASVAGSVAQEIVACFARPGVERAWVNNGGDVALHLAPGARVMLAVCDDARRPVRAQVAARGVPPGNPNRAAHGAGREAAHGAGHETASIVVDASSRVRGVATSGWPGRSFSLGVADAVTVLADTAARADAAATMIANAVDCEHPAVLRRPARELKDDTDLGSTPVTVDVGPLPAACVEAALDAGAAFARECVEAGLAEQVRLWCQGRSRIVAR